MQSGLLACANANDNWVRQSNFLCVNYLTRACITCLTSTTPAASRPFSSGANGPAHIICTARLTMTTSSAPNNSLLLTYRLSKLVVTMSQRYNIRCSPCLLSTYTQTPSEPARQTKISFFVRRKFALLARILQ